MVLLDQFANKSNTFQHSLSLPFSLSRFLPFPPWVFTSSDPGSQDRAVNVTLQALTTKPIDIRQEMTKSLNDKMAWQIQEQSFFSQLQQY